MRRQFQTWGSLLVLTATFASSSMVSAKEKEAPLYETASDVIERAYFKNSPDFYRNNTFRREIDWLLGPGTLFRNSFPENEIARDADLINKVYKDLLVQQATNDPYIRTPDLPNPYNSSILMSPRMNPNQLRTGTEFRFDAMP